MDVKNVDFLTDLAQFQPKQIEAFDKVFERNTKYLLYGGAAHGGKSYFLRWLAVALGMYYFQKYGIKQVPIGLFSEDYPTLKDRQVARIKREFPAFLGTLKEGRDEGYMFEANPEYGGFQILLRNLDDPAKYASSEFAAILVEELTKNPLETFEDLRFRLRYKGVEDPKFVAATNPGSIGHGWVKKFWIDPDPTSPDPEQNRFVFVRSLPTDNKFTTEEYLMQLKSLPEQKRKAFLLGSWDVFEGQVFTEWDRNYHVVRPFQIPEEWPRFISLDWGVNAPFSVLWYANDNDGRTYVYRELYMNGQEFESKFGASLTPRRLARVIKKLSQNDGEIEYTVADPSIWNSVIYKSGKLTQKDYDEGESIAEIMMAQGLNLIKGDNDRINGLARFREALAFAPDGKPWLQVFEGCYHFIRTIPSLVYSTRRTEDVETRGEDHHYDSVRYFLMSRPGKAVTIQRHHTSSLRSHYLMLRRDYEQEQESEGDESEVVYVN
jgi:phage terminase large subunit